MQITGIKSGGKVLSPEGLVEFSKKYLAYIEPIEESKTMRISIYTLE